MKIQWYPGHMKKTRELIQESLKISDAMIEILDARAPSSSRNNNLDDLVSKKTHIILLCKSDLADVKATSEWMSYYQNLGKIVIPVSKDGKNDVKTIKESIQEVKNSLNKNRAILTTRIMIVGIPNVGKSTIINRLAGKSMAKVENRPGVTRTGQWVSCGSGFQILDTPGILSPNFEDQEAALKLAFIGTIKDNLLDLVEVGITFCEFLRDNYWENLKIRYKITEIEGNTGLQILEKIAISRKFLMSRDELDLERTVLKILDEFRTGKIGRISLENPT